MEIVVNHVTKTIKNITVIEDVSLTLTSGTIYGLRGVNGSGKTMLMRLIAGLIRPTEGTITIDGKVLGKDISFPRYSSSFLGFQLTNYYGVFYG